MQAGGNTARSAPSRAGKKQGFTVIAGAFLPILAIVSMLPAVPMMIDHFAEEPTAGWKVPALVSAPGLAIAILSLFAGMLIDRFGRRKLLLAATALYGLIGAAPFLLENINAVYAFRLALGVTEAVMITTLNTLLADYWDEGPRRKWLGLQAMLGPFLAAGVIVTSGYVTEWRWNGIFLVYLVALPIFLAMWAWLYEPERQAARTLVSTEMAKTPFPFRSVLQIGVVTLFASTLYYAFTINGGLVFREVGIHSSAELGRLTAIPSLFIVVGGALFMLIGKWPHQVQLATCLAIIGGGIVAIGLAPDWRWMVGALMGQQVGAGMVIPTLIAWTQTKLPFEHRGRGMGVWTACFFVGQFFSPFVVTLLRGQMPTMQATFVVIGVAGVVGGLGILLLLRDHSPQSMRAAAAD